MNAIQKCFRHLSIKEVVSRSPATHRHNAMRLGTATRVTSDAISHLPQTTENPPPFHILIQTSACLSKLSLEFKDCNVAVTKNIKDPHASSTLAVDCPMFESFLYNPRILPAYSGDTVIQDPAIQSAIVKRAKNILKIRRRKMNKHKLRKLRKRMFFVYRKRKMKKHKKKENLFEEKLASIRKEGEEFDALEMVKGQVEKAKKGGYAINLFLNRYKL